MKIIVSLSLAAICLLAACSPVEPPQAKSTDNNGVLDIDNNNSATDEEEFDEISDRGRGIQYSFETNQNPHHYRNMSDKRYTISDDQDKIRAAVNRTDYAQPTAVTIVGNHAWVNINFTGNPKKEQQQKLTDKLKQAIQEEVPRYRIHLRINND